MDKNTVVAVCIIAVCVVLIFALLQDIDGAILGAGLTVIGTVIGYLFGYGRSQMGSGDTPKRMYMIPLTRTHTPLPYHRYELYKD